MRMRFLPIAIFATVLMLGVKVSNFWSGPDGRGVTLSHAQEVKTPADQAKSNKPSRGGAAGKVKISRASASAGAETKSKNAKAASEKDPRPKTGELPSDPTLFTQAEIDLLQKLASRRTELERWSQDLVMREQLLKVAAKAAEKRIDMKVTELLAIQGKLRSMLKQNDREQEGRLKRLVKIYESMKPKNAARIFMELDMPTLLDVVERMREAKAAPIIAKLEPGKAKRITTRIAVRRKFRGHSAGRLPSSSLNSASPPVAAN